LQFSNPFIHRSLLFEEFGERLFIAAFSPHSQDSKGLQLAFVFLGLYNLRGKFCPARF
jgi:hypothetical protein